MVISETDYIKEIHGIEKKYESILSNFNLNFPRPINFLEEKRKFFMAIADDKIYNPVFKFEKKKYDEDQIKKLNKLKVNTHNDLYNFKLLYKERVEKLKIQIKYHKNWGTKDSSYYALQYFGKPSFFLLLKAKKYIKDFQRETVKFKTLSPKIAGNRLKKEVKRLTGNDIKLKFVESNAKVNISPVNNIIHINPNERFTSLDIKRLKVHEIGVHYMRYYNASKWGIGILERGTSNYVETEEGLAVYAEHIKGVSSKAQMFVYAGRVVATYYCTKKSFYDIFEMLRSLGFNDEIAFTITFRAKRNMCNTCEKGGFTKDYLYFKGFHKIEEYAKNNDIRDLFIGKIKIEDLKLLRSFIDKNKDQIETIFDKDLKK